ncbi:MAG: response regulator [Ktedonobacterales bacterium]
MDSDAAGGYAGDAHEVEPIGVHQVRTARISRYTGVAARRRVREPALEAAAQVGAAAGASYFRGECVMMQPPDNQSSRRIRLLIVDDMPDMAQNVQKLLHFERDIQVVGVATSGRDAIAKAGSLRPDVVLMDINLRDMDGLQATEIITRQMQCCVVMMSVQSEPEYLTRAMMVGARGYLIKPFTSDDLVNTVRTAAAAAVQQRPPQQDRQVEQPRYPAGPQRLRRIVAVYSPKGGVGRSVLAANLAVTLKQSTNSRVVLVDANLQSGDSHVLLNINSPNSIDDLREAGSLDQEIINGAVAPHESSGIGLLRAPIALESAELFTADAMKAILIELREHFDYLVVDTDTTFTEATLTVLEMADLILMITTLEVTTINRVAQALDVIDRLGYPRAKVKLICNRVDSLYGIQPKNIEPRLRTHFLSLIPDDARLVVTSVNRGVPFVLSHKSAPISKALQTLAQRVENLAPNPEPQQPEKKKWSLR